MAAEAASDRSVANSTFFNSIRVRVAVVFVTLLLRYLYYAQLGAPAVTRVTGRRDLRSIYTAWPKLECGRKIGWVTR